LYKAVMPVAVVSNDSHARIYAAVKKIPRGCVATYGQVARMAGLPGHAREVGYALRVLKRGGVPWHRVVNAQGTISVRSDPRFEHTQRQLLEKEGVVFEKSDRINLPRYLHRGLE
jgi:methylated-DNA-protein-cysteine methyltransferase-like protein